MKNAQTLAALVAIAGAALSASALAQSLAEKELWKGQTDDSDRYLESTQATCKAPITLSYDRSSWTKVQEQWSAGSPNGRCQDVFNALESICRGSADGQKAVAAKIRSVKCSYGGKTTGYKLSVNGQTIDYAVEIERGNVEEEIIKTLKSKL